MSLIVPPLKSDVIPEKRSGHVAVFYKGLLVVFGGYFQTDDDDTMEEEEEEDVYLPSDVIWFYSCETYTWRSRVAKGCTPGGFVGACASVVDDILYLFGGFHEFATYTNKLYQLHMSTLTWYDVTNNTLEGDPPPSPRDKFGCWVWKNQIFYFGGFGEAPAEHWSKGFCDSFVVDDDSMGDAIGWNNQLYCLDCGPPGLRWTKCYPRGEAPYPRAAFAYAQIAHHAYLFGGRFQAGRRNDMFRLDLKELAWEEMAMPHHGSVPVGRSWHVMATVSDQHLFVYGGMDTTCQTLDDAWVYNIAENRWWEVEGSAGVLAPHSLRLWHTACTTDTRGEVVVFGGSSTQRFLSNSAAMHVNKVAVFRFSPLSLRRLCRETLAKMGT